MIITSIFTFFYHWSSVYRVLAYYCWY